MIVVTGSTGHVGGVVVRELARAGAQVRALTRNEAKAEGLKALGAELFLASVEDPSRMEMAFDGAEAVFVMTPPLLQSPDPREEHKMALASICHALQAAHVSRVVLLSSIGAQHAEGTGAILKAYDMEQALFALPLAVASIRAAYFMENLLPLAPHVKESGELPVVLDPLDRALPMIATEDIGVLAAKLLSEPWSGRRIVELEGPQRYSMQNAAEVYAEVLGRAVSPVLVPQQARQAMYEQFGITPGASADLVEMADGLNNGLVDFEGGEAEHVLGATTLDTVLRQKQ